MTRVKECVLYRGFEHGDIFDKMTCLWMQVKNQQSMQARWKKNFMNASTVWIEIAGSYGFIMGNLWHDYLG